MQTHGAHLRYTYKAAVIKISLIKQEINGYWTQLQGLNDHVRLSIFKLAYTGVHLPGMIGYTSRVKEVTSNLELWNSVCIKKNTHKKTTFVPSLSTVQRVPGNLIRRRWGAGRALIGGAGRLHAPRLIAALLSATRHRCLVPFHCWARGSSSCKYGCGRPQTTIVTAVCYWEQASVLD